MPEAVHLLSMFTAGTQRMKNPRPCMAAGEGHQPVIRVMTHSFQPPAASVCDRTQAGQHHGKGAIEAGSGPRLASARRRMSGLTATSMPVIATPRPAT